MKKGEASASHVARHVAGYVLCTTWRGACCMPARLERDKELRGVRVRPLVGHYEQPASAVGELHKVLMVLNVLYRL